MLNRESFLGLYASQESFPDRFPRDGECALLKKEAPPFSVEKAGRAREW
ncbi:MAG: hypothetical protein MI923_15635 [Phycisphaerales bacterium]|nr:hypothetical protein [Phycisphaerales bacterium]